jgi:hypothetical protein
MESFDALIVYVGNKISPKMEGFDLVSLTSSILSTFVTINTHDLTNP